MPTADPRRFDDPRDPAELELDDRRRATGPAGLLFFVNDHDTGKQRHVDELVDDDDVAFDASRCLVIEHDQLAVRIDDLVLLFHDAEELARRVHGPGAHAVHPGRCNVANEEVTHANAEPQQELHD